MIVITANTMRTLAVFLLLSQLSIVRARILDIPLPTPTARLPQRNGSEFNKRADIKTTTTSIDVMSICGYENGDRNKMRTVNPGSKCQLDTWNTLWGFCPTTITIATQCGFAGACIDQGSCSSGCRKTGMPLLTTIIWYVLYSLR